MGVRACEQDAARAPFFQSGGVFLPAAMEKIVSPARRRFLLFLSKI